MEFSSPFFFTRSLACCSLQREAFLSLPFLFSNGWQNVGACNHEIPFLSSYPFTFPCISAVDIAGRADFLPSSVLGLFQFPSIKHAQRQLPLSQTPPWLVMPCSRPNSRGAPGHPSQFLGCTCRELGQTPASLRWGIGTREGPRSQPQRAWQQQGMVWLEMPTCAQPRQQWSIMFMLDERPSPEAATSG